MATAVVADSREKDDDWLNDSLDEMVVKSRRLFGGSGSLSAEAEAAEAALKLTASKTLASSHCAWEPESREEM